MGRGILLLVVALAIAAGVLLSEKPGWRPRRAPAGVLGTLELEPILRGALGAAPSARDADVTGDRSATRFWRREYAEASFAVSATLDPGDVVPFLRAVEDSMRGRLEAARVTLRGESATHWPDSLGRGDATRPMALTIPYAARRKAGWVTLRTHPAPDGRLTLWVGVFEGPKPSD